MSVLRTLLHKLVRPVRRAAGYATPQAGCVAAAALAAGSLASPAAAADSLFGGSFLTGRQTVQTLPTGIVRGQQPMEFDTPGLMPTTPPSDVSPAPAYGTPYNPAPYDPAPYNPAPYDPALYDPSGSVATQMAPMTTSDPLPGQTLPGQTLPGQTVVGDPAVTTQYDPFSGTVPPASGFDPYAGGYPATYGGAGAFDPGAVYGGPIDPLADPMMAPGMTPYMNTPVGALNAYGQPKTEAFGINGPQPYRYGWREKMDLGFNGKAGTDNPDIGGFSIGEFNATKGWTNRGRAGWTYSLTPELNYRWLEGPTGPPGLPASLFRFGSGGTLASPFEDGFSIEFSAGVYLASDFENSLNSHAWQFDAGVVGYLQLRRDLLFAFGFQYWDRVDDVFIPVGGFIWQASDLVEVRATFPRASIDVFIGTPFGAPTWVYLNGEFRVEGYQVGLEQPRVAGAGIGTTGIQILDWRALLGTRWESGWLVSFVEAGVIFGREVEFDSRDGVDRDFDVDASFIGRFGFKW